MRIPDDLKQILSSDPEVMSGVVCFVGTRVPVTTLLDYIAANKISEFKEDFPRVTESAIEAVLKWQVGNSRKVFEEAS
ncbi:MAG: DUF433 domain-containing protein [Fimbriimonadaceae bacterium]|nr:MAG: DUF433 domain-containing protein [Fimbriimonadaceae bacterium]